jgi:hypothetical protein
VGEALPPTLNYEERRGKRWTLADLRRLWPVILAFLPVFGWQGYTWWYQHTMQSAERQYNARVAPLLKADPRFGWVFKGGEAGYITKSITPTGTVESPADKEALRVLLQGANPPMPLDMQFVTAMRTDVAATQAATAATQAAAETQRLYARVAGDLQQFRDQQQADQERNRVLELAGKEYDERVVPLLKREARFRRVLLGGGTVYIFRKIKPFGFVETQADLEALENILQDANPPMPLDLEHLQVAPDKFTTTRPATTR